MSQLNDVKKIEQPRVKKKKQILKNQATQKKKKDGESLLV